MKNDKILNLAVWSNTTGKLEPLPITETVEKFWSRIEDQMRDCLSTFVGQPLTSNVKSEILESANAIVKIYNVVPEIEVVCVDYGSDGVLKFKIVEKLK